MTSVCRALFVPKRERRECRFGSGVWLDKWQTLPNEVSRCCVCLRHTVCVTYLSVNLAATHRYRTDPHYTDACLSFSLFFLWSTVCAEEKGVFDADDARTSGAVRAPLFEGTQWSCMTGIHTAILQGINSCTYEVYILLLASVFL